MALDASGRLLATASADRRVMVWDVELGFCTHAFRGHTGVVSCVLFHPDIERLLVSLLLLLLAIMPFDTVKLCEEFVKIIR
jgi:WD40 repeat protein